MSSYNNPHVPQTKIESIKGTQYSDRKGGRDRSQQKHTGHSEEKYAGGLLARQNGDGKRNQQG
jgi:hypothetical protein